MSDNERSALFRKKTMDRIASPEDLTDYLKVTNPGVWVVLIAVIVLMAGMIVWSCVGTLETSAPVSVIVSDHTATVVMKVPGNIAEGMPLRVSTETVPIAGVQYDDYGRAYGKAEVSLPDGTYDGTVVTDQTHPIKFLIRAGDN